jgi:hypothetical protein
MPRFSSADMQLLALFLSPVIPVIITLWWQSRKEKREGKRKLFITLMAHRKAFPPTIEWVNSLNLIDVVFASHSKVVDLWHQYYSQLHQKDMTENAQAREHTYLQLLSEMAKVLGYKRLQQTDIDKYYSPQAHGNQLELNYKTQREFLRVLEATAKFETAPKTSDKSADVPLLPPKERPRGVQVFDPPEA